MTTLWLISYLILWLSVFGIAFLLLGTLNSLGKLQWQFDQLEATRPVRKDREGLEREEHAFVLMPPQSE